MRYISPAQCRGARAILNWSQPDLAKRCAIHVQTISNFEQESGTPTKKTLQRITDTLEAAGMEFIENDGVRKKQMYVQHYQGTEGFRTFMNDVYETAKKFGGDICLFNTQPLLWYKHLGQDWYEMHNKRMSALGDKIKVRIAIREGDSSFILSCAEYRWFPKDKWKDRMYYAYGPKLALLNFTEESINIMVFTESELADSFRVLYDIAWEHETIPALK